MVITFLLYSWRPPIAHALNSAFWIFYLALHTHPKSFNFLPFCPLKFTNQPLFHRQKTSYTRKKKLHDHPVKYRPREGFYIFFYSSVCQDRRVKNGRAQGFSGRKWTCRLEWKVKCGSGRKRTTSHLPKQCRASVAMEHTDKNGRFPSHFLVSSPAHPLLPLARLLTAVASSAYCLSPGTLCRYRDS